MSKNNEEKSKIKNNQVDGGKNKKDKAGAIVAVLGITAAVAASVPFIYKALSKNEISYTVNFLVSDDIVGGVKNFSQTVKSGTTIGDLKKDLASIAPEGYEFEGFYSDASCLDIHEYKDDDLVGDDTRIYVKYVEIEYTIIFNYEDAEGSSHSVEAKIKYHHQMETSDIPNLDSTMVLNDGIRKFEGWKISGSDEKYSYKQLKSLKGSDLNDLVINKTVNLTASYGNLIPKMLPITINFSQSEGTVLRVETLDGKQISSGETVSYGTKIRVVPTIRESHNYELDLIGLSQIDGSNEYIAEGDENGNISISFTEQIKTFSVTFTVGQEEMHRVVVEWGETATPSITNPTKSPDKKYTYTFLRWVDNDTGEEAVLSNVRKDMVVRAEFEPHLIAYSILSIPENVKVFKDGAPLTIDDEIYYDDILTISYENSQVPKDEYMTVVSAEGAIENDEGLFVVQGDISISLEIGHIYLRFSKDHSKVLGLRAGSDIQDVVIPSTYYDGTKVTGIEVGAFKNKSQIRSITLPDGISRIENETFYNCENLSTVNISSNIEFVGSYAFYGCGNLTDIQDILNNLSSVEPYAFYGCESLGNITLPAGLTKIKEAGFFGCKNLTLTSNANIDEVGSYAFYGCENLSNIDDLISNLTAIEDYAFYGCRSIENITVSGVIESIGSYAFANCTSLEDINDVIKNSTSIGASAFFNCSNLTSLTIPQSLSSLGNLAFSNCSKLENILWNAQNVNYNDLDIYYNHPFYSTGSAGSGISLTFGEDYENIQSFLFGYREQSINCKIVYVTIPKNIKSIGNYAFYGNNDLDTIMWNASSLSDLDENSNIFIGSGSNVSSGLSVIFGESVERIPNYAFYGSSTLKSITIGKNVKTIGVASFANCYNAVNLLWDAENAVLETMSGISGPFYGLGRDGSGLSVEFGINCKIIPSSCLESCSNYVKSVSIGENVETINYTFNNLYYLTDLNWNTNKVSSYESHFRNAGSNSTGVVVVFGEKVVNIPSKILYLSDNDSTYRPNVVSLTIGENVKTIGDYAFSLPKLNELFWNAPNVKDFTSSSNIFYYCGYGLNDGFTAVFGEKVTHIPANLFNGYRTELYKVALGDSVESIGESAFVTGYGSIQDVVYGGTCEQWNEIDFANLNANPAARAKTLKIDGKNLEILEISSASKINELPFRNLLCLKEVVLHDCVTTIAQNAFGGCDNIESMTLPFVGLSETENTSNDHLFGVLFDTATSSTSGYVYQYSSSSKGIYVKIPSKLKNVTINGGQIKYGAFYNCSSIETVNYSSDNFVIESYAFYGCSKLKDVNKLLENMTEIADYTFYDCDSLTEITIPQQITNIGERAFCGCSYLNTITLNCTNATLSNYAFSECTRVTKINWNATNATCSSISDNVYHQFYNLGSSGDGVSVVFGEGVESIPKRCFGYSSNYSISAKITSVTIPESVTSIGDYAFCKLTYLKEINWNTNSVEFESNPYLFYESGSSVSADEGVKAIFGENVTKIPSYIFYGTTNLKQVENLNTITSIGGYAFDGCMKLSGENINELLSNITEIKAYTFYNCDDLTELTIPEQITSIGNSAFRNCDYLTKINWNAANVTYDSISSNDNHQFYNLGISGEGVTVVFGESVESIPKMCFGYSSNSSISAKITSITIPESVTSIGNYAFCRLTYLKEINWNTNSVEFESDPDLFNGAGSSAGDEGVKVTFGKNVTKIPSYIFYGTSYIKQIETNNTIESIGKHAFRGCSNLSSEIINDLISNVTEILPYTFYGCESLTELTIPEQITSIGESAFRDCNYLTKINWNATNATYGSISSSGNHQFYNLGISGEGVTVVFGENVESIPERCFGYSSNDSISAKITSVTIPESVTSIGNYAFCRLTYLKEINWNTNSVEFESDPDLFNGAGSSAGDEGVKVTFGKNVTKIPSYIFYGTSYIKQIETNNTIKSIGGHAFRGCSNLSSEIINDLISNVTEILPYTFNGCSALTEITIPSQVTNIDNYAFYNCTNLNAITLNCENVSIKNYAFGECKKVTKINWNAVNATISPVSSSEYHPFYKLGQSGDGVEVIIGDGVESIPERCFAYTSGNTIYANITSITIPESVTSIGNYAFCNLSYLKEINWNTNSVEFASDPDLFNGAGSSAGDEGVKVTFGANVTKIPSYIFYGTSYIKQIETNNTIESIGTYAFRGCNKLSNEIINGLISHVTEILPYTFYGCSALTEITIPSQVTNIGLCAFAECPNVTKLNWNAVSATYDTISSSSSNPFYNLGSGVDGVTVVFGEGVESIPERCFGYNTSNSISSKIKSITIPETVKSIGNYAFCYLSYLENVVWNSDSVEDYSSNPYLFHAMGSNNGKEEVDFTFGEKVTRIPAYLFYDISRIKHITSLGNIENIGDYAFYRSGIIDLEIGNKVSRIGNYAFDECSALTSISSCDELKYVGNYAFYGCSNFASELTCVSDEGGDIQFGAYCLYNCYLLPNITINGTVSSIGDHAFYNCYSLPNITINGTVSSIGDHAFYNCKKLVNVDEIIKNLTEIPSYAFYGCENIVSVVIPEGMDGILTQAFYGCVKLTEVTNNSGLVIKAQETANGYVAYYAVNVYQNSDESELIEDNGVYYIRGEGSYTAVRPIDYNCTQITLSEETTEIMKYAFYGCENLTEITIPNSVTKIGDYAFSGCLMLSNVTIGSGVTSFGSYAFSNLANLEKLTLNANISNETNLRDYSVFSNIGTNIENTQLVIGEGVTTLAKYMFINASGINKVTLNGSISTIGYECFNGCSNITEVDYLGEDLDSWVQINFENSTSNPVSIAKVLKINGEDVSDEISVNVNINAYSFYNLSTITGVNLGENVHEIGNYAFSKSTVESINVPDTVTTLGNYVFANCPNLTAVTLGRGITVISEDTFYNCAMLSDVTLNGEVTEIKGNAFASCSALQNIVIPNSVNIIGAYCFANCSSLLSIDIPNSVTSIGANCFENCTSLNSAVFGSGLTELASYLLHGCSSLGEVTIGENVETIASYAFYGCNSLQSVVIPNNVQTIATYAFRDCSNLSSIDIASSVTSFGDNVFYSCSALSQVVYRGSIDDWVSIDFYNSSANPIYYARSLKINDDVVTTAQINVDVKKYAFYNLQTLQEVTFESGVTTIGSYAFAYCSKLDKVVNNATIEEVQSYAFEYCKSLRNADDIIKDITYINGYTFYYCEGLSSITIHENISGIGNYAFENCYNLLTVTNENPKLDIQKGQTTYGYVAYYAVNLNTTDAEETQLVEENGVYYYQDGSDYVAMRPVNYETESITISDKATKINDSAFGYCKNLSEITLGKNIKTIGVNAFAGCSKLSVINWNAVSVEDFSNSTNAFKNAGSDSGITVIFGDEVTSVPAYALYDADYISVLTLSKNISKIGKYAFSGCENLTLVNWNITKNLSFDSSSKLFENSGNEKKGFSVVFGDDVTKVPKYAFYSSKYLNEITLPEGMKSIDTDAFAECTNVTKLNWNATSLTYNSVSSYSHPFYHLGSSTDGVTVIFGEGVQSIPYECFGYSKSYSMQTKITSITIPESVTSIGSYAFCNLYYLKEINWNTNSVADYSDESYLFYGIGSNVKDESGVKVTFGANVTKIPSYIFKDAPYLKQVETQNTIESIGKYAFSGCTRLSGENINELILNLTEINAYTFNGCSALTEITIPSQITEMGTNAFGECVNVTKLNWNAISLTYNGTSSYSHPFYHLGGSTDGVTVIFGEGVESIPYECFGYSTGYSMQTKITNITIPETVTSVGNYAFCNMYYLKEINWNTNSVGDFSTDSNLFYGIGSSVPNDEGTKITFGEKVTKIPAYLFYQNNAVRYLKSVEFLNAIESIGKYAFYNCMELSEISIGENVTNIGSYAFCNCSKLPNEAVASLMANLTEIKNSVFRNCTSLTEISIPQQVTSIGEYAFDGCSSLNTLTLDCDNAGISNNAFSACRYVTTLNWNAANATISSVSSSSYHPFYDLGYYSEGVTVFFGEEVVSIPKDCFGWSTQYSISSKITSVTIPESVTSIGSYAFCNLSYLKEINWNTNSVDDYSNNPYLFFGIGANVDEGEEVKVTFGENVTKIPAYIFYGASYLVKVETLNTIESIGRSAFNGCSKLPSEMINNLISNVTVIKPYTFNNCSALTELTIPSQITEIDDSAFCDCRYVTKINWNATSVVYGTYSDQRYHPFYDLGYYSEGVTVVFGEGVESIPERCFGYNTQYSTSAKITSVTIPESVTSIGSYAFCNLYYLKEINWNTNSVDDYSNNPYLFFGIGANVDEGEEVKVTFGENVTKIPAYIFYGASYLVKVETLNTIESIGRSAFSGCTNLSNDSVGNLIKDLTIINNSTFYNCDSITEVLISDQVTSIGDSAFYDCDGIGTLTIGKNVETIGTSAFCYLSHLVKINWNAIHVNDFASNTSNVFYNGGISADGIDVVFSDEVEYIPAYCFCCRSGSYYYSPKIKTVTIGENVSGIGSNAFSYNTYLSLINWNSSQVLDFTSTIFGNSGSSNEDGFSVVFGENVTHIPNYIFSSCSYLKSVTLGENVSDIGQYAFNSCGKLSAVQVNSTISAIGTYAFAYCYALTSIDDLVTNLNKIEPYAFAHCESATTITLHEQIKEIGGHAFEYCYNLSKINWNAVNVIDFTSESNVFRSAGTKSDGIDVAFGDNVRKIPNYALYGYYKSTSYSGSSYYDSAKIKSVKFGKNVKSIGAYAFSHCEGIGDIETSESMVIVGQYAFDSCEDLTSISLRAGKVTIDQYAFNDCYNLESVNTAGIVDYVGTYAFHSCRKLSTVDNLIENISTILPYTFYGCYGLSSVTIPKCIKLIDTNAFIYCYNLFDVINKSDLAITLGDKNNGYVANYAKNVSLTDGEHSLVQENGVYYYRDGDEYIAMRPVDLDCTELTISDNATQIVQYAFYGLRNLESVVIGSSVREIGDYSFYSCKNLTSVTISSSVSTVGSSAFDACTALSDVNFLGSVDDWVQIEFKNSVANPVTTSKSLKIGGETLTNAVINADVKNYAFYHDESLETVVINDSATSIGASAFAGCVNLSSATIGEGVSKIGKSAFSSCTNLAVIYWNAVSVADFENNDYPLYKCGQNTDGMSIVFGGNVNYIPGYLTRVYSGDEYPKLRKVDFGSSQNLSVGNVAFGGLTSLEVVENTAKFIHVGDSAFSNCSKILGNIDLSLAESIGDSAFYNCAQLMLNDLELTHCVSIGSSAFYGMTYISGVTFDSCLERIGSSAFSGCTGIKKVNYLGTIDEWTQISFGNFFANPTYYSLSLMLSGELLSGQVYINKDVSQFAFYNNNDITSVVIGSGVHKIGKGAFYGCWFISEVYYEGTLEEFENVEIETNNIGLKQVITYYLSENDPYQEGNALDQDEYYWHFKEDDDKTPVIWQKQ